MPVFYKHDNRSYPICFPFALKYSRFCKAVRFVLNSARISGFNIKHLNVNFFHNKYRNIIQIPHERMRFFFDQNKNKNDVTDRTI